MRKFVLATVVASALAVMFALPATLQAQEAKRSITKIAGDLYRFQNNFHYSVFLVTPDGIIATDPINPEAAKWLQGELKARFGVPVKYLIYSHDHRDHIAGGEVFASEVTVMSAVTIGTMSDTSILSVSPNVPKSAN